MTQDKVSVAQRAGELREAFDRSFADPLPGESEPSEAFIAVSLGSDRYALRLSEISGLYTDKKIVALPGTAPELLGLTSFQGALAPVYDLGVLLDYTATATPRWQVLLKSNDPIAVAFGDFEGYISATRSEIARDASSPSLRQTYVAEVMRIQEQLRLIVSLPALLDSIMERARQGVR